MRSPRWNWTRERWCNLPVRGAFRPGATRCAPPPGGEPRNGRSDRVEDYAVATVELDTGAVVQLACSWRLQAGCDAVISAAFYGTEGGAGLGQRNGRALVLAAAA